MNDLDTSALIPIQDGVMVCVDKKHNLRKWVKLENVFYKGEKLSDIFDRMETRIKTAEESIKTLQSQVKATAILAVSTAEKGESTI
jgi:hypothetical protein